MYYQKKKNLPELPVISLKLQTLLVRSWPLCLCIFPENILTHRAFIHPIFQTSGNKENHSIRLSEPAALCKLKRKYTADV